MYKLVGVLADTMGDAFGEVAERADFVATVVEAEEAAFGRTLDRGLEIFTAAAETAQKRPDKTISGENAFQLYDTFGFPLDLTQLMARERGLKVDTEKFDVLMEIQRITSRSSRKADSLKSALSGVQLPMTDDSLKYETNTCSAKVVGWTTSGDFIKEGDFSQTDKDVGLILDHTCFYAEAGGQVGDTGKIEGPDWCFEVERTSKIADCVIHSGKLQGGTIRAGQEVTATVGKFRQDTQKNHTATHLLQWALQQVLGESVHQKGSEVSSTHLRFDFTYPKALSTEELKKVEGLVRKKIDENVAVTCVVMPIDEAKKLGAMALFGEKYGQRVRVVGIGAANDAQITQAFSREFCGGTHLDSTGQIGGFAIIREESISAGVRRITALTGAGLVDYLLERSKIVDNLTTLLKAPPEQITGRVKKLLADNKKLAKDLKSAAKKGGTDTIAESAQLLKTCEKIGETSIITGALSPCPIDQARRAIDSLKKKAKSAAIVLGIPEGDDKVMLLAAMTDDLIKKGLKAGDLIKKIAPIVDGRGGGKPQMAQAGGKNQKNLPQALEKATELIKTRLT